MLQAVMPLHATHQHAMLPHATRQHVTYQHVTRQHVTRQHKEEMEYPNLKGRKGVLPFP